MPSAQHNGLLREKTYLLFFLSGLSGLAYEVLWVSRFGRLFGSSSYAIGTVLAAYMGGLAIGSFVLGRKADKYTNGLRAYAILEILVAATALLVPVVLWASRPLYVAASISRSPLLINLTRLAVSLVVLLPPTFCMGATLPVLTRFCSRQGDEAGERLGELYALNTFGAVAGCLLTGFILLPALGERYTLAIVFSLNALIFITAWIWSRDTHAHIDDAQTPDAEPETGSTARVPHMGIILAALAIAGFASMGFEIAWSRTVALLLGSSVYAFTAMLAVFLIGLAVGAALAASWLRRFGPKLVWFALAEAGIALWLVMTIPHYEELVTFIGIFNKAAVGHFHWILTAIFLACALIILVPAILMGTTIPLVMAVLNKGQRIGRFTGIVYAANTLGGILGSLLTGFFVLPHIGIQNTLLLCLSLNLAMAALLSVLYWTPRSWMCYVSLFLLGWMAVAGWNLPQWDPTRMATGAFLYGAREEFPADIVFHRDGVSCTVTVEIYPTTDVRTLRVNGKADASSDIDMSNQIWTGLLPMMFKPDADRVLVIGYGSGVSVGAVTHFDSREIDCAELERAVIEADPYFQNVNHKPLSDPRVKILVEDGRNIIETTRTPYDVIISEPSNPWIAGIADLFTQDHYKRSLQHLAPDGIICQWLQSYATSLDDFKTVARTFASVFPYHAMYRVHTGDYLLLGSREPLVPDLVRMQKDINNRPALARDLLQFCGTSDIRALLIRYFIFEQDVYDEFCADAPRILRDHHNTLGYTAVHNLFTKGMKESKDVHRALYSHKNAVLPETTQLTFTDSDHELSASMLNTGDECLDAGNLVMAEACYGWAAQADPRNYWAQSGLLKTAALKGATGLDELTRAVAESDPQTAHETARWLFSAGQFAQAEALLELLVDKYPGSTVFRARLASAKANLGKLDAAVHILQEAHTMDPLDEEVQGALMMFQQAQATAVQTVE